MNRRSFFRSLALIGSAVSASPHIFIPKFEPVRWKVPKIQRCEFGWFIAEFKQAIMPDYSQFTHMIFHQRVGSIEAESESEPSQLWTPSDGEAIGFGDEKFREAWKKRWTFPLDPNLKAG